MLCLMGAASHSSLLLSGAANEPTLSRRLVVGGAAAVGAYPAFDASADPVPLCMSIAAFDADEGRVSARAVRLGLM